MSGTKRKILSCSRPPLFCWVSFSPQGFITTQSPTFPAKPICPHAPFLGFKQTLHTHTQRPRGYPLVPKGDYTMCLLNARWPLVSSCLCNRQPDRAPTLSSRAGPLTGLPRPPPVLCSARRSLLPCPLHTRRFSSHQSAMQTVRSRARTQGGHHQATGDRTADVKGAGAQTEAHPHNCAGPRPALHSGHLCRGPCSGPGLAIPGGKC